MAFDGDVATAWRAAAFGDAIGQRIRVVLDRPITTDHVRLLQPTNRGRDRFITQGRTQLRRRQPDEGGARPGVSHVARTGADGELRSAHVPHLRDHASRR